MTLENINYNGAVYTVDGKNAPDTKYLLWVDGTKITVIYKQEDK